MGEKVSMKKSRLWRILYKPLMGTRVVPPDARADCLQLSEEEFPVFCTKCDYQLRGLPDGNCPECGKPFERARLLVEQYVREWGGSVRRKTILGRVAHWGFVVFLVCSALGLVTMALVVAWAIWASRQAAPQSSSLVSNIQWVQHFLLALSIAIPGSLAVIVSIFLGQMCQMRHKRRRVLDAVPVDPPPDG